MLRSIYIKGIKATFKIRREALIPNYSLYRADVKSLTKRQRQLFAFLHPFAYYHVGLIQ